MGKKGVSADEKRTRMLAMFRDSGQVWTLKDVEKGAPPLGIISQAVKDVLKQLTDDDLVRDGKVGVSTYYWSFPTEEAMKMRNEAAAQSQQVSSLSQQLKEAAAEREKQRQSQAPLSESEEVAIETLESSVRALQAEREALMAELESHRAAQTVDLHARHADIPVLKEAANRWTDSVFEVRKQVGQKFGLSGDEVDQQLELPPNLDYIE